MFRDGKCKARKKDALCALWGGTLTKTLFSLIFNRPHLRVRLFSLRNDMEGETDVLLSAPHPWFLAQDKEINDTLYSKVPNKSQEMTVFTTKICE